MLYDIVIASPEGAWQSQVNIKHEIALSLRSSQRHQGDGVLVGGE